MYQFDLLATSPATEDLTPENDEIVNDEASLSIETIVPMEPNPEVKPTEDENIESEDGEVSLGIILHEQEVIIAGFETDKQEFKALLKSFKDLNEVKASIESYGIDDRLLAQVGDELDNIAGSFKLKDAEATLEEIEAATEGIVEYIKEKAGNLAARWKSGWIKFVKSDAAIKQKLRMQLAKIDKSTDPTLNMSKRIVANYYNTADVTIPIIEKVIMNALVVPEYKSGKDIVNFWSEEQAKHVDKFGLGNDKCLLKYRSDYHWYERDDSQMPEAMTIGESGLTSITDLLKYGQMVLDSHLGDTKMEQAFNKQWDAFISALRLLPIGETQAVYALYDWGVETLYTAFVESDAILRQYAVQTLITAQEVA